MLRNWIAYAGFGLAALGCWDPPPSTAPAGPRTGLPDYEPAVCEPICAAVRGDGDRAPPRLPAGAIRTGPLETAVIVADGRLGAVDTEQLRIHLHGWGLPADFVEVSAVDAALLGRYATVIVLAPEAGGGLDPARTAALVTAVADGTSLVWLGLNAPAELGPALGVEIGERVAALDRGVDRLGRVESALDTGADLEAPSAPVFEESYDLVVPRGAEVLASFHREGDDDPAMTAYRADATAGRAVLLPFNALGYWDEHPDGHAWTRAEMVLDALMLAHPSGAALIDPFPDRARGALLIRVEDLSPGGSRSSQNFPDWIDRFEWVEHELGQLGVRMNLAIVARFKDPARDEEFGWDAPHPQRERLRGALRGALERGATLISHGLTHQQGTGDMDYTGIDWEMSDDDTGVFLPYDEQLARIEAARTELEVMLGVAPAVWETPHLEGNLDTYAAAREAGYTVMTEADGNLFPNRFGVEGAIGGALLNVPHTGSFVPTEDEESLAFLDATARSTLPRLIRLRAPFYVFYHGFRDAQADTLLVLSDCCTMCGFWTPTVPEFAAWWESRTAATVDVESLAGEPVLRVTVRGMPANGSVTVRLPDGHAPDAAAGTAIARGAIVYVQVPVPAGDSTVDVRYVP